MVENFVGSRMETKVFRVAKLGRNSCEERSRKRGEEIKRELDLRTPSSLVRYFFVITISSSNDYRQRSGRQKVEIVFHYFLFDDRPRQADNIAVLYPFINSPIIHTRLASLLKNILNDLIIRLVSSDSFFGSFRYFIQVVLKFNS